MQANLSLNYFLIYLRKFIQKRVGLVNDINGISVTTYSSNLGPLYYL